MFAVLVDLVVKNLLFFLKCMSHGETLVLCFTNKACQNILSIIGKDANVYTFDSKFYKEEDGKNLLKM